MAMTAEKLAYHRAYRAAHKDAYNARFKKWHEANGAKRYYENVELTRAIKRKSYYISVGKHIAADLEQQKIDAIRTLFPKKQGGKKETYSATDKIVRRKACIRKARYKHISGLPDLLKEPGKCEICGRGGKMCLDHCHKENVFRGWICDDCNIAMGRAKENVETLKAMIKYIQKGANRLD